MSSRERKYDYPADALRVAREQEGLTQREVWEAGGFAKSAYENWEAGVSIPDPGSFDQLGEVLTFFEPDWKRYAHQWRTQTLLRRVRQREDRLALATSVMGRYLWDLIYGRSSDVA